MSIKSVMPSNHFILCHPLLLLPSIFPCIRVFSSESVLHIRWPKDWSFTFGTSPSNKYSGLISFRLDWFVFSCSPRDSQKFSPVQKCSAFFVVQLSHPYMTTGKTIALTRRTFVGKVMSLLFNMLYRLVIAFLPRSKCLLISQLQSPSGVILVPKKTKPITVSIVSPFIYHEVKGLDAMILVFGMLSFKPTFSVFSFTFIKRLHSYSSLSAMKSMILQYQKKKKDNNKWRYLINFIIAVLPGLLLWASDSHNFISIKYMKKLHVNHSSTLPICCFNTL